MNVYDVDLVDDDTGEVFRVRVEGRNEKAAEENARRRSWIGVFRTNIGSGIIDGGRSPIDIVCVPIIPQHTVTRGLRQMIPARFPDPRGERRQGLLRT